MGAKFGEAKKIITNLVAKGAKLQPNFTVKKAASTVAPVIASSMILNELRQVPVVKEVLSGLDWLYDTLSDLVKKVPVIGWAAEPVIENVVKPVASALGGYKSKEERNDKTWYTAVKEVEIPDTTDRPVQPGYNIDIVKSMEDGAVPRMYHANINLFKPYKILAWQHEMTNLWENLVNNLRRSYTYNEDEISAFMNNNISYYILGKYLEKKLGFVKFSSPDYPTFRDDWITKYDQQQSYGMQYAGKFTHLDPTDSQGYSESIDAWNITVELERNFLLPPNIKKWIDHYIGSVFILDAEDTKNWKCIDVTPLSVTLLDINKSDGSLVERNILLRDLNYQWYLQELTNWFKVTATMRADVNRAQVLSTDGSSVNVLTLLDTGWFTSYEAYEPVLVKDPTFIQALINGYSKDTDLSAIFGRDMVRFDYLDEEGKGDPYTILLFAGGIMPTDTMYLRDGHITLENIAMVIGSYSDDSPLNIPVSWANEIDTVNLWDHLHIVNQRVVFTINSTAETINEDRYVNIDQDNVNISTNDASLTEIQRWNDSDTTVSSLNKYSVHFNTIEGLTSAFERSVIESYKTWALADVHKVVVCIPIAYTCPANVSQSLVNADHILYARYKYDLDTMTYEVLEPQYPKAVDSAHYQYIPYTKQQVPGYPYNIAQVDVMVIPWVNSIPDNLLPTTAVYRPSTNSSVGLIASDSDIQPYDMATGNQIGSAILDIATAGSVELAFARIENLADSFEIQVSSLRVMPSRVEFNTVFGSYSRRDAFEILSNDTGQNLDTILFVSPINNFINAETNVEFNASLVDTRSVFEHTNRSKYIGYPEWFMNVMGYCIPLIQYHKYQYSYRNNENFAESTHRAAELLKEDYVPFFLSRYDLAYILYYMYSSLFRVGILPYAKKSK